MFSGIKWVELTCVASGEKDLKLVKTKRYIGTFKINVKNILNVYFGSYNSTRCKAPLAVKTASFAEITARLACLCVYEGRALLPAHWRKVNSRGKYVVTSPHKTTADEVRAARVFVWSLRSARSPAHFPLSLPLFPLAQVLISQPQDQRRSLAISQREPLIPHRSTRDTAAPWTPYEAPQSSPARREGKRASREKKSFKGGDVCIFFHWRGQNQARAFSCRGTWNNEARAGFNKARFPSFQLWREADESATESDR